MKYLMRLANLLCVILNSISLFLGAITHQYLMLTISALFVIYCGNQLLKEEIFPETNENTL